MYRYGRADLRSLQQVLGHESLSTTELYTHLDNNQLQNTVNANLLEKYFVQSGDIVIYNPGVIHMEHTSNENPFQFLFLALDNFTLPGLPPGFLITENEKPVFSAGDYRFKLEGLFTDLLNETKSHINWYEMMSGSILLSILIIIMRIRYAQEDPDVHNVKLDCQKVKSFIDDNYTKPITLEDLSQIIYISRHHLVHLFKKEIGVPPIKYLILKRMDEARHMLSSTELSISKISEINWATITQFISARSSKKQSAYRLPITVNVH